MAPRPIELSEPALFDTSVWTWVRDKRFPELLEWFNDAVSDDLVLISDMVAIELLRVLPNYDRARAFSFHLDAFDRLPMPPILFAEIRNLQLALAQKGVHRSVPPSVLFQAASAINADVPLVHYDKDFDLIAEASGLDARWFVEPGSLADISRAT